jgi:hypothetical protein
MLAFLPLLLALQAPWKTDLLADAAEWRVRPDWIGPGAATTVGVERGAEGLTFRVGESRMKWRLAVRCAPRELAPWLIVRYRATGLGDGDYFLWLDDGSQGGRAALSYADVTADGEWHTAALNLDDMSVAGDPVAVALQVSSAGGPAEVTLAELRLASEPPPGTAVTAAGPLAEPLDVPIGPATDWSEQPGWLANPGAASVSVAEGAARLAVAEAGRGMKWSAELPTSLDLSPYRYALLRYRAIGGGPSDYAVCVMGEKEYAALALPTELMQDGAIHSVAVPLRDAAARVGSIGRLALQVQARKPGAWLELLGLRLTCIAQPEDLADQLAPLAEIPDGWTPLGLTPPVTDQVEAARGVLRTAGLGDDPLAGLRSYAGVPLEVLPAAGAPTAALGSPGALTVPVGRAGTELYLLAAAGMVGEDQPARGGRLRVVPDGDRFSVDLAYADGETVECVPLLVAPTPEGEDGWGLRRGLCLLRCPLRAGIPLATAALNIRSDQIGLSLLGATVRTGAPAHPSREDGLGALPARELADWRPPAGEGLVHQEGPLILAETPEVRAALAIGDRGLELRSLWDKLTDRELLAEPVSPLLRVRVDGEERAQRWVGEGDLLAWVGDIGVRLRLVTDARFGAGFAVSLRNAGAVEHRVEILGPVVTVRLPGEGQPTYCFPDAAAVVSDRDGSQSGAYAGWGVRHAFLAASTSDGAGGVALYAPHTEPTERSFRLTKAGHEVTLGVTFPERTLAPEATRTLSPVYLGAYAGDWHVALERYRAWHAEALPPIGPRPAWFRRVWNFRQRFLYDMDALWGDRTKPVDLTAALDEADREFGGAEYLHVFDWGNVPGLGRIYGRPGDPEPGDSWPGGYAMMRDAIAAVRARGVHAGLYIEGYLLEEKGPLGQRIGQRVVIRDEAGKPRYWPNATELFACPGVEEWRAIQAETYRKAVAEMEPDGMYVDEFGFCSDWRRCYAGDHGHQIPDNPALNEAGLLRRLREAIDPARPGVALYSEESPPDANAPLQDGSFTYSMQRALSTDPEVPLNLYRFVIPSFKTIEILVCDKPTADWAAGPARVFFNGEAIWLEGPSTEWFAPATRAMIRRCHGILKAHEEAFASDDATPLVPTLAAGIHANRFVGPGETVYTLYNARHTSYRGPVLALPEGFTGDVLDAWHGDQRLIPSGRGIEVELAPLSVGCIVVRGGR